MAFLPLAQVTRVISDRGTIGSGKTNHIVALSLTSCMPPHSAAAWEAELSIHRSHHTWLRPASCAVTTLESVSYSMKQLWPPPHLLLLLTVQSQSWPGVDKKTTGSDSIGSLVVGRVITGVKKAQNIKYTYLYSFWCLTVGLMNTRPHSSVTYVQTAAVKSNVGPHSVK